MRQTDDNCLRSTGRSRRWCARNVIVAVLACIAAFVLLVPFNLGGCGGVEGLNGIHTGNSFVDQIGVGNMANSGAQATRAITIDDEREANIGRNVALQVTTRYGVTDNDHIERYVTLVGLTVADASPRSDYPYCFAVLNSDEVNAYSGPDGFVMITRGALFRMKDESELAGVLGHEIGHINKHHGKQAVTRAGLLGAAGTFARGNDIYAQFGQISDSAVNAIVNTGFSEPEEMEADAEGVRYAAAAGYDPQGYLNFVRRMAAAQGGGKSAAFSTHPGLADRARKIADQISKEGLGGKGQTLRERFEANVTQTAVNR